MDILKKIAQELDIKLWQVEATVKLIDEGNTIPFIARYRKEAHGSLNDEQLDIARIYAKYYASKKRKHRYLQALKSRAS